MSPLARTFVLLSTLSSAAVGLAACDSSSEYEACTAPEGTEPVPGARRLACPPSTFAAEGPRSREVGGAVRRGEDLVAGALVRIDPASGFEASGGTATTITDAAGLYRGLRDAAFRYDLSVRLGDDLLFYRAVAARYVEPSLEGPRTFARAHASRVDVRLDRAVPEGRTVAFFVSGDGVYAVTGDLARGLTVLHRDYTSHATIHAVEHDVARGFEEATAYGRADLFVDPGSVRLAAMALQPISDFVEPRFVVTGPRGFTASTIDVRFGFAPTSDALLVRVPLGGSKRIPVVPGAGYTYQVQAALEGAISDSGEILFDVHRPTTDIELPRPPEVLSPADGEARSAGDALSVDGAGVFEHVLTPTAGGRTIRVVTRQRGAILPDPAALGAEPAAGPHVWTVRSYPTVRFAEELSGAYARRYRPVGISAPRSIVLR